MTETKMRPYLLATVGLPHAGKSTWARDQGLPIVSPDAIRLAMHGHRFIPKAEPFVWAHARLMVDSLFGAGCPGVVLDACNTTRKRRAEWLDPSWQTFFAPFPADVEVCVGRARQAGDLDILPTIARMAAAFEPLGPDERHLDPFALAEMTRAGRDGKYGEIWAKKKAFHPGEPVWLMRATDPFTVATIRRYAEDCAEADCSAEHLLACGLHAKRIEDWQKQFPNLVKRKPD